MSNSSVRPTINFSEYSQRELEGSLLNISSEKHPENFAALTIEISRRKQLGLWDNREFTKEEIYNVATPVFLGFSALIVFLLLFLGITFPMLAHVKNPLIALIGAIFFAGFLILAVHGICFRYALEVSVHPNGQVKVRTLFHSYSFPGKDIKAVKWSKGRGRSLVLNVYRHSFILNAMPDWIKLHSRLQSLKSSEQ
jgi:hypothetical protein